MRTLFLLFVCCTGWMPLRMHAQGTNANWYFGSGAGLFFPNGSAPVSLAGNAMSTLEGSACISDAAGHLLFYTDGVNVYDRYGQFMPNGSGLDGESSSTQSGLIVGDPANADLFHVFTVAAEASLSFTGYGGLSHSTVDMQLNGGLGDVVLKNDPMLAPTCEKLTAVRHANGRDVWVVAHGFGDNAYYAFLLTCSGLRPPVVSNTGRRMGPGLATEVNEQAIGQLDIAPDGRHAAAIWRRGTSSGQTHVAIDVLSFDAATGTLALLDSITHKPPGGDLFGIGLSFAAGSRFLYTTEGGTIAGAPTWRIHQYDMSAPGIAASEVLLIDMTDANFGALACGPDGVIYVADPFTFDRLRRIQFPDLPGTACGLDTAGMMINGQATLGLPNVWENTIVFPTQPPTLLLDDTSACAGPVRLQVYADPPSDVLLYHWNTGSDSSSTTADTTGNYVVEVVSGCDTVTAEADVRLGVHSVDLGPDLELCDGTVTVAQVPSWAEQWAWSDGWEDPERSIGSAGTIELAVVDSLGCLSTDTLTLAFVDCDCKPYVPNAFTPDGDDINDAWNVVVDCRHGPFHLQVFDRWGKSMFESMQPDAQWDGTANGTPLPPGVYAWTMDLDWQDTQGPRLASLRGHVVLMR